VPEVGAPAVQAVAPPDFEGAATPGAPFHVGLSLSAGFLDTALWSAHQAGALCLRLSTANVGLLDTGLFRTLLPSLGALATRDGKDAPMMVVLRPARPPTAAIGAGTLDPVTHRPRAPLLTLTLDDLGLDFYALLDDRFVRLFTLTADVALPLGLAFEGCDRVVPVLGDTSMLVRDVRASNSELLAEDPQVLAELLPAVLALAEPALAGALPGFTLPPVGGFALAVSEAKGVTPIAGTAGFSHLGLFARLLPAGASCAVTAPKLEARLLEGRMPRHEDMRLDGHHRLPVPEAVLAVSASGKAGTPEFAVRVDDGLWSPFRPAAADGTITVAHPRFVLQGLHAIEVRARVAEDPQGLGAPVRVGFVSDYDPPTLALTPEPPRDRLAVVAHDAVTPRAALSFAYRVGQGAFGAFGAEREISLSAVAAQGGVGVRVRDELGNVAEAAWRAPEPSPPPPGARPDPSPAAAAGAGCGALPSLPLAGLAALLLFARRRTS
jgi:hypothetical protein